MALITLCYYLVSLSVLLECKIHESRNLVFHSLPVPRTLPGINWVLSKYSLSEWITKSSFPYDTRTANCSHWVTESMCVSHLCNSQPHWVLGVPALLHRLLAHRNLPNFSLRTRASSFGQRIDVYWLFQKLTGPLWLCSLMGHLDFKFQWTILIEN